MKHIAFNKWVIEIVSSLLIILFIYTAINKIVEVETFRVSLRQSPILGKFALPISYVVPLVEIVIVFLLSFSATRKIGLLLSFLLILLFTIYIAYMLSTTSNLPCNCGGVIKLLSWQQHLILNIVLLIFSAIAWILSKKSNNVLIAINRHRRTPA